MKTVFPDRPPGLVLAKDLRQAEPSRLHIAVDDSSAPNREWSLHALTGCIVELFGTASLTAVMKIMREAQQQNEAVCWIQTDTTLFYPPDLPAHGVNPEAIYLVSAAGTPTRDRRALYARAAGRTADTLLRSQAFRCIVMDLGAQTIRIGVLARLLRFVRLHGAVLICLTSGEGRLGSLVTVRVRAEFVSSRETHGQLTHLTYRLRAEKDRRASFVWELSEQCGHAMYLH